jgi:dienelactone hydrolase
MLEKDRLRDRLTSFLGLSLPLAPPPVTVLERIREDGHTRSLIRYVAPDGDEIPAFLFEPISGTMRGGVLALHQHNSQWELGKSEIAGLAGDPMQAFGPALARAGVTVLAPDLVGFESRLRPSGTGVTLAPPLHKAHSTPEGWLQHYNQMAHRLVRGDLVITKLLVDSAVGLSVLQRAKDVEPSCVGVIGHSHGGHVALFLAGLDVRVSFACVSGATCSYRHKLAHGTGLDMALIIPGFTKHFDLADLIRCTAPRKMLVVSSEDDPSSADANDLVRDAAAAFVDADGAGNLQHLRVPGPHALDTRRFDAIVSWTLAEALGAGQYKHGQSAGRVQVT